MISLKKFKEYKNVLENTITNKDITIEITED